MNILESLSNPSVRKAIDAYKAAIAGGSGAIQKDVTGAPGFDSGFGLQARSLQSPAQMVYPLTAILRRMIPRVKPDPVSKLLEWKQITAINTAKLWGSIAESSAGSVNKKSEKDRNATLKTIGVRDYVSFEAQFYGADFQDVKALAVLTNLQTVMTMEESVMFGGNITAVPPPAAPTGAVAAGGALAADTYTLRVAVLTMRGWQLASGLTAYDPSTSPEGISLPGAASAGEVAAANDKITYVWADVPNALAYAMFVTKGAGPALYAGYTTVNSFVLSSNAQITAFGVPTLDKTANALDFDGIVPQYNLAGSGAYYKSLDGANLSSDGLGGVMEFTDAMQNAYLQAGVGPNYWIMNPIHYRKIISLISGSSAPLFRINLTDGNSEVKGGMAIRSVLNPFVGEGGGDVELIAHRTIPPGTILGLRLTNPYDYSQLANALDMAVVQDYYTVDYATSVAGDTEQPGGRVWPFGVYCHEVLRLYFAGGGVILHNVGTA